MDKLVIYTDGASRGNPGKSAIAFLIFDINGTLITLNKKKIGIHSNNEAEYLAMFNALDEARNHTKGEVDCYSDSKLMISQLKQEWKIKKTHLKELHAKVKELEKYFKKVTYHHVRRTDKIISMADSLVNEALGGK